VGYFVGFGGCVQNTDTLSGLCVLMREHDRGMDGMITVPSVSKGTYHAVCKMSGC
jgi:hypothetical protein